MIVITSVTLRRVDVWLCWGALRTVGSHGGPRGTREYPMEIPRVPCKVAKVAWGTAGYPRVISLLD